MGFFNNLLKWFVIYFSSIKDLLSDSFKYGYLFLG